MSISIALTKEQRGLLQEALEIAREKFKGNARKTKRKLLHGYSAQQIEGKAAEAQQLLDWITNAENVIIEERND
jgi:hypothetical protein